MAYTPAPALAGPDIIHPYLLSIPQPQFPDFRDNYLKTVVIPEQARQAALEAARVAQAAQQAAEAAAQPQPLRQAPTPSGSCSDWMTAAGITDTVSALYIINIESGCNPNAVNPSSGACGMGQQLPCGKWAHVWNDPVGGLIDMQSYVVGRYGSWAAAVAYEQAHHSY